MVAFETNETIVVFRTHIELASVEVSCIRDLPDGNMTPWKQEFLSSKLLSEVRKFPALDPESAIFLTSVKVESPVVWDLSCIHGARINYSTESCVTTVCCVL